MKKFLIALVALAAFASATDLTGVSSAGTWDVDHYYTISSAAAFDTLNGTADSTTLVATRVFESGYQYILAYAGATDAGTGAPEFVVRVSAFAPNGDFLYYVDVDTITATAGVCDLEIGGTVVGTQYRVKLIAGGGNGAAEHKVNQCVIYRRNAVLLNKITK